DHQMKIAGKRVECSEIESAILKHTEAVQAVVKPCNAPSQETRLCAYVTMPPGSHASSLRRALADRLPQHMIQAWFVVIDSFPRTSSGKINTDRLPAPDFTSGPIKSVAKLRTVAETRLHSLWAQALHIEPSSFGCDEAF